MIRPTSPICTALATALRRRVAGPKHRSALRQRGGHRAVWGAGESGRKKSSEGHAIFFRNRNAQRANSKFAIKLRMTRFGQYSKRFAPRKMIARMSAIK